MNEECNTCGDTGRWESTTEEQPTVLTDLGPCPDCELGEVKRRLYQAARELLELIDTTVNPFAPPWGDDRTQTHVYSTKHRVLREDWSWGYYDGAEMRYSTPAPLAILWEEGPDDWTLEVTLGQTYQEVLELQEKHDVLFEPYTSWALGVYDERN